MVGPERKNSRRTLRTGRVSMIFLHENAQFGRLNIEETFLYFDGPRLFTVVNAVGQRYVVNCLDIEEKEETWLLTAVSERRVAALKDGELDLRTAFVAPELDRVFKVTASPAGQLSHSEEMPSSKLTGDMLPLAGALLPSSEQIAAHVGAPFLARSLKASVVLLRLFPKTSQHEAPAESVGGLLTSFGEFLKEKLRVAYQRADALGGQVNASLVPEVNVVGAFASSLGIEFAVRGNEGTVMEALRSAVEDLASVLDLENLEDH